MDVVNVGQIDGQMDRQMVRGKYGQMDELLDGWK